MADQYSRGGNNNGSGGIFAFLIVLVSLILIVGPFFASRFIDTLAQFVIAGVGLLLLIVGSLMVAFTQFYVKASSNQAFIRTGLGGPTVVLDGGAMVIPQFHQVRFVSLETVKLVVQRTGRDALITGDNLRVDVNAEFYIRVNRTPEGVTNAATTLGDRSGSDQAIMDLVGEKLISAMRTVAARSELDHLHSRLDEYRDEVKKIVEHDLEPNGLSLETVAVSHLNQTSPEHLDPSNNLFDAQGARKIAEIVNKQRVERNLIETQADQTVKDQEVTRDKALYLLDIDQRTAAAAKDAGIRMAEAGKDREANEYAAQQRQISETANIEADKAVELASVEKEKTIEVANQDRQAAAQKAEIDRTQAVEVKKREQLVAVADAEKKTAVAETAKIDAEKERETSAQALLTVTKKSEAERSKEVTVINKEAEAATKKIERNMEADVEAYSIVKQAEASETAATKQAAATLTLADANQQAKTLEAKGSEALAIVPVNVNMKQVEVDKAAVDVLRDKLAAQTENEKMAFDLQVELAKIDADKYVRAEYAKAMGQGLAASNMTIYGDTTALAKMLGSFQSGQQVGKYVEGVMDTMPERVVDLATATVSEVSQAASRLLKKVTGTDLAPEIVEAQLKEEMKNTSSDDDDSSSDKPSTK